MSVTNYDSTVTGIGGLNGTMSVTTDDRTNSVTGISYKGAACTILPGTTRQSLQFQYGSPGLTYNFHGALVGDNYHGGCALAEQPKGKGGPGADPNDNWTANATGAGDAARGKARY